MNDQKTYMIAILEHHLSEIKCDNFYHDTETMRRNLSLNVAETEFLIRAVRKLGEVETNYYIGVCENDNQYGIIIESPYYYEQLTEDIVKTDWYTKCYAPNWGGCDRIDRLMKYKNLRHTNATVRLNQTLTFSGKDNDLGHEYDWNVKVNELRVMEKKEEPNFEDFWGL